MAVGPSKVLDGGLMGKRLSVQANQRAGLIESITSKHRLRSRLGAPPRIAISGLAVRIATTDTIMAAIPCTDVSCLPYNACVPYLNTVICVRLNSEWVLGWQARD